MGPFHNTQINFPRLPWILKLDYVMNSSSEVKGTPKSYTWWYEWFTRWFWPFQILVSFPVHNFDPSSFLQDIPKYKMPFQS